MVWNKYLGYLAHTEQNLFISGSVIGKRSRWDCSGLSHGAPKVLWHHIIIINIIYFENVCFFHAQLRLDVCLDMRPLHISLNTAHSGCKPSTSMYSSTHSLQVFLPLPLPLLFKWYSYVSRAWTVVDLWWNQRGSEIYFNILLELSVCCTFKCWLKPEGVKPLDKSGTGHEVPKMVTPAMRMTAVLLVLLWFW